MKSSLEEIVISVYSNDWILHSPLSLYKSLWLGKKCIGQQKNHQKYDLGPVILNY